MTSCAYCGHDTIDAHQIEVCASCCSCREDLSAEVHDLARWVARATDERDWDRLVRCALALTQLAARLSRTGEAE